MEKQKQIAKQTTTVANYKTPFSEVLKTSSKTDLIRSYANLTPALIINLKYPSIGALSRKVNKDKVEAVVGVLLSHFNSSFEGQLSTESIEELVVEITANSEFRSLALEDIFCFCQGLKRSQIYGKMTLNKILQELEKYSDKKANMCAEISKENADRERYAEEVYERGIPSSVSKERADSKEKLLTLSEFLNLKK